MRHRLYIRMPKLYKQTIVRPIVIHITGDFPDPFVARKTRAVQSLIDGTQNEFRHIVYSLNRVNGWSGQKHMEFGADRMALSYSALPKGLLWQWRLRKLGDWIAADLKSKNIAPDVIEAHKFTIEGLVGYRLAKEFNTPLICDIQGDTDTKILNWKPHIRNRYRGIFKYSSVIFSYAPWPLLQFKKQISDDLGKCRLLPVIPEIENVTSNTQVSENRLLSVFHLDSWRRKNITGLLKAVHLLAIQMPDIRLDIYGGGSPKSVAVIAKKILKLDLSKHVFLQGEIENRNLPAIMKNYAGLVLPSFRESYGLVYAEALLNGLPVLFSKDRAIDGYLQTDKIGYACDPRSVPDIVAGILYLLSNQMALKEKIAALQEAGGLNLFKKDAILQTYRQGIHAALGLTPENPTGQ